MTADGAPQIRWTRLAPALPCAFLPILLTFAFFIFVASRLEGIPGWLQGLPLVFTVYAGANAITVLVVAAILGPGRLRELGLVLRFTRKKVLLAIGAFVAGVAVFSIVNSALSRLGYAVVKGMPQSVTAAQTVLLFVTVGVIVPFCEELLFRTVWYMGLRQRLSALLAALLSASAFAAIHIPYFGVGGMVFISFWTFLPITLYARTGDITAPWLMHALNNTFAYVIVPAIGMQAPGT